MKDQLITLGTVKLADIKGFYTGEDIKYNNNHTPVTQSLLQKWLREKHNIIVTSLPHEDEIPECEGEKRQTLWEDETIDCRETPWLREITTYTYYHSYEKALEIGLQEALKLI